MSTSTFYQCLICRTFFGNLWKIEQHIKRHEHDNDEKNVEGGNQNLGTTVNMPVRRRGMLPIQKTTFPNCFVRVERHQGHYQSEDPVPRKRRRKDIHVLEASPENDNDLPNETVEGRRPRSCRLKAEQKLKQVTALLREETNDVSNDEFDPVAQHRKSKNTRSKLKVSSAPDTLTSLEDSSSSESSFTEAPTKRARATRGRKGHTNPNPAKCDHCPATFPNPKTLATHIVQEHKDKAKIIICPVSTCKSPILNFHWLLDHLRMHAQAERKEPSDSMSNSMGKSKLRKKIHLDLHRSKVFYCKLCLSKHVSFEKLQTHLEAHPGPGYNLKCPETNCVKEDFEGSVRTLIAHIRLCHPYQIDPFNERRFQKKKFPCDKCDYSFEYQFQLDTHRDKVHSETLAKNGTEDDNHVRNLFTCPVCKREFTHKYNLYRHFHLHLETNPHVCDFPNCERKFNSAYNLRRHKTLHYEKTPRHQCPICPANYRKKESLFNHLRNVHNPDELPGNFNSTSGSSKPRKRRLPVTRIRTPIFQTYTEEEIKALREKQKQSALKIRTNDGKVEEPARPVLEAEVQLKHELREPSELIKTEDLDEEIHLVDKILIGKDGSAVHVKGEHLSPEKPLSANSPLPSPSSAPKHQKKLRPCSSRNDVFQKLVEEDDSLNLARYDTRQHIYHTGKSFKCPECDDVFTRAWTLQLHMTSQHKKTIVDEVFADEESENGQDPKVTFMCGVCAYPAKSKEDMAAHLKKHKQNYEWKCLKKGCGRIFPTQKKLDDHVNQIHLGSRDFPCKFCTKAFISKSNLNVHERKVHHGKSNGERSKKKCPLCPATVAFSYYKSHMKKHKDLAKGVEGPKCMLCQDTFACKSSLKRHIDCVHLGKPLNIMRRRAGQRIETKKKKVEWFEPLMKKTSTRGLVA